MQAARDRQKSYADLRRRLMKFQVGDRVMLKVSPWKRVVRFGEREKLNPRYVGPFKVLEKNKQMSDLLLSMRSCSKVLLVSEESLYGLNKLFPNPFSIVDVGVMSDTPKNPKHRLSYPVISSSFACKAHGIPKVLTYSMTLSLEGGAIRDCYHWME
ncbi:hypothetical protein Tco_0844500 [Tanacetum coccineum]